LAGQHLLFEPSSDRGETMTTNGARGCGFEAAHVDVVGARTPFDDLETAQLSCQR
jgi:hypothetical protein